MGQDQAGSEGQGAHWASDNIFYDRGGEFGVGFGKGFTNKIAGNTASASLITIHVILDSKRLS